MYKVIIRLSFLAMLAVASITIVPIATMVAYAQTGRVPTTLGATQPPPLTIDPAVIPQLAVCLSTIFF